nr:hypothetical protein [Tanacetum cinerariifolium]
MKRVGKGFFGRDTPLFATMMVQAQEELGEDISIPKKTHPTPIITQPSSYQPSRKQKPRKTRRQDTELPQTSVPIETVADEAANEEMYDSLEGATTTATSLDAEQDRGNIKITKTAQAKEIANLKKRVKRLERKRKSRSHGLKRLYKVGLSARVKSSADEESLGSISEEVNVASIVTAITNTAATTPTISMDEITLAKALIKIKTSRPKAKGRVMQDPSETPRPTPIISSQQPLKLVERLHAEEQEQFTDVEKEKLFIEFMEKRRKLFAAKRDEERRQKPQTKAQQRNIMTTYLKNMDGWKPRDLKNKSFAEIKELFDKAMERINSFVNFRIELVEESTKKDKAETIQKISSKRAGDELEQESSNKQKIEDKNESVELKRCLEIVMEMK